MNTFGSEFDALQRQAEAVVVQTFGELVTHQPIAAAAYSFSGIVEISTQIEAVAPGTYCTVFAQVPAVTVAARPGDTMIVRNVAYLVVDVNADTPSSVRMTLQRLEPLGQ